jgi:hypothetical protein
MPSTRASWRSRSCVEEGLRSWGLGVLLTARGRPSTASRSSVPRFVILSTLRRSPAVTHGMTLLTPNLSFRAKGPEGPQSRNLGGGKAFGGSEIVAFPTQLVPSEIPACRCRVEGSLRSSPGACPERGTPKECRVGRGLLGRDDRNGVMSSGGRCDAECPWIGLC